MKTRYLLLCGLVVLATLAVALFVFGHLPARIPTHWNMHGEIDGYGPRAFVFLPTALMLATIALFTVLPALSPQRFKIDSFIDTYWYACLVAIALLGYLQLVMVWGAYTHSTHMGRALQGGIAVFVTLVGNVIGKVRRNFWLGVRTPWTLANERVWYATHRLAAKSMVVGGLLALAAIVLDLPGVVATCLLVAAVAIPVVWSLVYYKRLERSGALEA